MLNKFPCYIVRLLEFALFCLKLSLETVIVFLFLDTHAAFLQVMSKVC